MLKSRKRILINPDLLAPPKLMGFRRAIRSADTNPTVSSVQSVVQKNLRWEPPHSRCIARGQRIQPPSVQFNQLLTAAIEIIITNPISQLFSTCTSWQQLNHLLQSLSPQFNQLFNTRTSWQQSKQLPQTLSVQYSPLLVSFDLF